MVNQCGLQGFLRKLEKQIFDFFFVGDGILVGILDFVLFFKKGYINGYFLELYVQIYYLKL